MHRQRYIARRSCDWFMWYNLKKENDEKLLYSYVYSSYTFKVSLHVYALYIYIQQQFLLT